MSDAPATGATAVRDPTAIGDRRSDAAPPGPSDLARQAVSRLRAQVRPLAPVLALVFGPAILLLGAACAASWVSGTPLPKFTRDPTAIMRAHPLTGVISQVGILLWCSTVAVCLFSAWLLRSRAGARPGEPAGARGEDIAAFFLFAGALTAVLLFDDLFMVHDWLAPRYLHLDEKLLFAGYGLGLVALLWRYREILLRTEFLLLALALSFFATSILVDLLLPEEWLAWHHLLEDGPKFVGIAGWFGYFVRTAAQSLQTVSMTDDAGQRTT